MAAKTKKTKAPKAQKTDSINLVALKPGLKPELAPTPPLPQPEVEEVEEVEDVPSPQQEDSTESSSSRVWGLKVLEEGISAAGTVLRSGDKIWAVAPWGQRVIAEIVTLYEGEEGEAWAYYEPVVIDPPGDWGWIGGCARCLDLASAQQKASLAVC